MHPEPVSEMHLTDGTILRQTYIGTTPRNESPHNSSPSLQRKGGGTVSPRKISSATLLDSEDKTKESSNNQCVKTMEKVNSPYHVINPVSTKSEVLKSKDPCENEVTDICTEASVRLNKHLDSITCSGSSNPSTPNDGMYPLQFLS